MGVPQKQTNKNVGEVRSEMKKSSYLQTREENIVPDTEPCIAFH